MCFPTFQILRQTPVQHVRRPALDARCPDLPLDLRLLPVPQSDGHRLVRRLRHRTRSRADARSGNRVAGAEVVGRGPFAAHCLGHSRFLSDWGFGAVLLCGSRSVGRGGNGKNG